MPFLISLVSWPMLAPRFPQWIPVATSWRSHPRSIPNSVHVDEINYTHGGVQSFSAPFGGVFRAELSETARFWGSRFSHTKRERERERERARDNPQIEPIVLSSAALGKAWQESGSSKTARRFC